MNGIRLMLKAKRLTVIIRQEKDDKKIAKIKFSKQESEMLRELANMTGMQLENIIRSALEVAIKDLRQ